MFFFVWLALAVCVCALDGIVLLLSEPYTHHHALKRTGLPTLKCPQSGAVSLTRPCPVFAWLISGTNITKSYRERS